MNINEQTKELLGSSNDRIRLHDFVREKTNECQEFFTEEHFSLLEKWSVEALLDRLKRYEGASRDLRSILALIGYWGEKYNKQTLTLPISRLAIPYGPVDGYGAWIGLRWYPSLLLVYSAGIAAVAAEKYDNLKAIFDLMLPKPNQYDKDALIIIAMISNLTDIPETFNQIPGLERRYIPRSDHLHGLLLPEFEELFGFKEEFNHLFDRFEVLLALEYAYINWGERPGRIWGPPGRFAWMFQRGDTSPYHLFISEAELQGEAWPIIRAGFFGGSLERFDEVATEYAEWMGKLGW